MKRTCLFNAAIDKILSFDLIHPKGQPPIKLYWSRILTFGKIKLS